MPNLPNTLSSIQPALNYLLQYPHAGGMITFLVSFLESLAVIGSLIPGSVTMTAIGMLIGTGILPGVATLLWATSGAITGDYLSYWFGARYQNHIREIWPLKRYSHWLEAGEQFFHHHGGKSIIIGRFFGPMRSMVPMVAGMLKMERSRFILAILPSAVLWSLVYLTPGFLLGALSVQLPPQLATKFLFIALLISALIWLTIWLVERSFYKLSYWIEFYFKFLWTRFAAHPSLCRLTHWLTPIEREDSYNQLARLIFFCFMLAVSTLTVASVWQHGLITAPNDVLYYLFQSIQTDFGRRFMLTFTLLGNKYVLCGTTGMIALWMLWKHHRRAAFHFVLLFIIMVGVAYTLKFLLQFPRPGNFSGYAFPSGHTTLFVGFIGFLSVLINRSLEIYQRHSVYYMASLLITALTLSRLYLEVHWFSDIFGGLVLGITCILLVVLLYRRKQTPMIPPIQLLLVSMLALIISVTTFIMLRRSYYYTPPVIHNLITMNRWWSHVNSPLPNYRLNRFGKPAQTFNVQWAEELGTIKTALLKHGWQEKILDTNNLQGLLIRITKKSDDDIQLPLLPLKHGNHTPALLMIKTLEKGQRTQQFILRLWVSDAVIPKYELPIWIGAVDIHVSPHNPLTNRNKNSHDVIKDNSAQAIQQLTRDLKSRQFKLISIPKSDRITPPASHKFNLGKNILLIRKR